MGLCHDRLGLLLDANGEGPAEVYYGLGDLADYREVRDRAALEYADQMEWARKCWINICESGRFSADRTIADYAKEVWKIQAQKI